MVDEFSLFRLFRKDFTTETERCNALDHVVITHVVYKFKSAVVSYFSDCLLKIYFTFTSRRDCAFCHRYPEGDTLFFFVTHIFLEPFFYLNTVWLQYMFLSNQMFLRKRRETVKWVMRREGCLLFLKVLMAVERRRRLHA